MKYTAYLCSLLALTSLGPLHAQLLDAAKLKIQFDEPSATYRVGQPAKFTVQYTGELPPGTKLDWTLGQEQMPVATKGSLTLSQKPQVLEGTLQQPGFMNLKVVATSGKSSLKRTVGVAFSPEKIAPSLPIPDDFDAFWESQKQRLAKIPANPRLTPVQDEKFPAVVIHDVQLDSVDAGVSGYLAKPAKRPAKSLPAILTLHGAGVRSSLKSTSINWANRGFLAMDINAHGLPNGQTEAWYKAKAEGDLKDYRNWGRDDRESSYFVKMFLRDLRALEFLLAQPEWDGRTVVVYGTSQGGYQAIATAYLDSRVTFVMAGVPAGCDHSGMKANRVPGWPKIVPLAEDRTPDAKVLEVSRYIDNVNFSAKTKAKGAFYTAGFIDFVCPPTGVYAAYNALPIKKRIFDDIPQAHAPSKQAYEIMLSEVLDHARAQGSLQP